MTEEIKGRIEQIKAGQVPEGYIKQYKYIFPVSWKLYHLGELTQNNSRKNMTADELPTYSINNQVGFIPQNEQFDEGSYSDLDKTCYKIVKRGEFAYNPARINVGSLGLLKDKDAVIVSSLYVCFSLKREFSNLYFENWFTTTAFHKEILRNLEGSVREYLFYENFSNIRLPVPPLPEQKKIAEILRQCDKVIELKQSKIEELQKLKKTCLSKMFPKEGHNVPELRFPGFTDAWEQRKFDEVFDCTVPNNTLSRAELSYDEGTVLNVHYGDVLIKYGSVLDVQKDDIPRIPHRCREDFNGALLQDGDVIIADTAEDETTGKACEIGNLQGSAIVSGLHTMVCRPRNRLASGYLGYYLNSNAYHHQLLPLMQGIKVLSLSRTNIQKTSVSYPTAVKEQQLISSYFSQLDNLITLHQRELEETRKYKKALMQLLLTGIVRVQR